MKYYLFIITLMIPLLTFAQKKGDKKSNKEKAEQVETIQTSTSEDVENNEQGGTFKVQENITGTDALSVVISQQLGSISDLNKLIELKTDTITHLNDSIGDLIDMYEKNINTLKDSSNSLKKENSNLENKTVAIASISNIVYKQCLLYPLERRYNKTFIDESIQALNVLGVKNNPKYKEVCDTYWDLLNEYSIYNQELLEFLQSQFESFSLKHWNIPDVARNGCKSEVSNLKYYTLYKNKDVKPWKSISYIDKVLDDLLAMLSGKQQLDETNFKNLIDRITPKVQ